MTSMQLAVAQPIYRARPAVTYSPSFVAALDGAGAWCREARATLIIAAQVGIMLDEEDLVLSDVRDLQALRAQLLRQAD